MNCGEAGRVTMHRLGASATVTFIDKWSAIASTGGSEE